MTTTTAAISQPMIGVIHAFFNCLQVSPYVWMSTPVSRPLTEVYSSFPERTSRQPGALLPGCDCARCCWFSSCCCATEVLTSGRTRASTTAKKRPQTANGLMSRTPLFRPGVFVLGEIARLDCGFPADLVALAPRRGGVNARGRVVLPGF